MAVMSWASRKNREWEKIEKSHTAAVCPVCPFPSGLKQYEGLFGGALMPPLLFSWPGEDYVSCSNVGSKITKLILYSRHLKPQGQNACYQTAIVRAIAQVPSRGGNGLLAPRTLVPSSLPHRPACCISCVEVPIFRATLTLSHHLSLWPQLPHLHLLLAGVKPTFSHSSAETS